MFSTFGVSSTFVMSNQIFRVHPFAAVIALGPHYRDDEAGSGSSIKNANEAGSTTADSNSTSGANVIPDPTLHPAGTKLDTRKDGQMVSEMRMSVVD